MGLLIRWLVPFLSIILAEWLFPNLIAVRDLTSAAIFGVVLALVNAFIKPILQFFALPLTCLTLGLFYFVINAVAFGLAAYITGGVAVEGFWGAFLGALVVSVLGVLLSMFVPDRR